MALYTARKLKEARSNANITQDYAAKHMCMNRRQIVAIESDERQVTADEIVRFAKLYKVDVRELLLEDYQNEEEEQRLANRFGSFLKLLEKLSDREIEDVYWVIKRKVDGQI